MGFAQNLVQCESALQVNKKNRKRKSGEAFGEDFGYIYGSVVHGQCPRTMERIRTVRDIFQDLRLVICPILALYTGHVRIILK